MKNKNVFLVIGALITAAAAYFILMGQSKRVAHNSAGTPSVRTQPQHTTPRESYPSQPAQAAQRVPAYLQSPPAPGSLPPVLPAANFIGKAREAYKVVGEIPQTIAQLPCYCHCDATIGHKSLHSCFVDDHASHCAVCVNEALEAYRLQKEQGLSPAQIRERIIAQYSAMD